MLVLKQEFGEEIVIHPKSKGDDTTSDIIIRKNCNFEKVAIKAEKDYEIFRRKVTTDEKGNS